MLHIEADELADVLELHDELQDEVGLELEFHDEL